MSAENGTGGGQFSTAVEEGGTYENWDALHSLGIDSPARVKRRLITTLAGIVLLLVAVYPLLLGTAYKGSPARHNTLETVSACIGIPASGSLILPQPFGVEGHDHVSRIQVDASFPARLR